MILNNDQYIS